MLQKLLTTEDFSFLSLQCLGVFMAFDFLQSPQVLAAGITLLSTVITVGFNVFKLWRDRNEDDEGKPRRLRLRGKRK